MTLHKLFLPLALLIVFSMSLRAKAALQPSCSDQELARLQATAASNNLANVYTTRTAEGGPYRKKVAIRHRDGRCEILSIEAFRTIHQPGHPDADAEGFVKFPDINASIEEKNLNDAKEKLKKQKKTSRNGAIPNDDNVDVD